MHKSWIPITMHSNFLNTWVRRLAQCGGLVFNSSNQNNTISLVLIQAKDSLIYNCIIQQVLLLYIAHNLIDIDQITKETQGKFNFQASNIRFHNLSR